MATNTPKLTLPKPDANDNFNRAAYNALIDAIDNNVGTKTQAAETHAADSVKHVTAEDKALWSAKASTAVATQSANGLMAAADKLALDNAQKFKLTQDTGIAKTLPGSSNDLNAVVDPGVYTIDGTALNQPPGYTFGVLTHIVRHSTNYVQIFQQNGSGIIFTRAWISGRWSNWQRAVDGMSFVSSLLGNKFTDQSLANFIGKAAGSTTENPHTLKRYGYASLLPPTDSLFTEALQAEYNNMVSIEGTVAPNNTVLSTRYAQQVFSFNLIAHVERTYGTIPGTTTAAKVAWLNTNLSRMAFNWWGFGSSPAGNKATVSVFLVDTGNYAGANIIHTNTTTTKLAYGFTQIVNKIDANGFVHFIAYAEPSNGTTPSVINTDYAELEVELSTGIWNNTPAFTWINATYQNSWASFDADRALKYAKDEKGTVTLRGTIKSGTVGTATPVMTLPAGFRPLESSLSIPITVSGGIGELQIQSSGAVSIASASYGASPNPSTQAHIYVRFFAGQ